ncbi:MAG TPA: hypothetical protein VGD77_00760 [Gemmatimonadaceae bacterium]
MLLTSSLALGTLAGSSRAASGQATLTATAQLAASATVTTTQLDFATITPGVTKSIAPQAGLADGIAGTAAVVFNTSQVTVAVPAAMTLTGPGATMQATLACAWAAASGATSTTPFTCTTGQVFTNASAGQGQGYVYVGGSIAAAESTAKPAGTYNGAVTVTATYPAS